MIDPRQYYTISEAATLVGCHRSTLLRDTNAGLIDCKRIRKGIRERKLYKGETLNRYRLRTLFINN